MRILILRNLSVFLLIAFLVMPAHGEGDGTLRRIRVPILMYHYVSPLPENADDVRTNLTVIPEQFRAHMTYLQNQGYSSVSLYEVKQALLYGYQLPSNPIVITFDDSYIDAYTHAFPILKEFGFKGTFFIITGYTDRQNPEHLTWAQIKEMADAGMLMETHTKSHVDLRNSDYDQLVYEIIGSIESIQAHTGKTSSALAYPMGRYSNSLVTLLKSFPIDIAVTTQAGAIHTSTSILELPRLRVSNDTTVYGLDRILNSN